jgi:ATP-dependent RNA helicase DDX42
MSTQVHERRRQLGVRLSGFDAPSPVTTFRQCGFDSALLAAIRKSGFTAPTPIQAQALPAVLSGRDVLVRSPRTAVCMSGISGTCSTADVLGHVVDVVHDPALQGIAQTGSGKTAAFVLPMLVHIMDQPELRKGEGPIAVIVAPIRCCAESSMPCWTWINGSGMTAQRRQKLCVSKVVGNCCITCELTCLVVLSHRELAEQIHTEARRFGKAYNLRMCAAFGGLNKHDQFKALKAGSEVRWSLPVPPSLKPLAVISKSWQTVGRQSLVSHP